MWQNEAIKDTKQPDIGAGKEIILLIYMRLSQQPALGALTFLRSFVAGKANFCSHLLASLVHFTVVKSQAILIIRLGVTEVISAVTLYLLPASKRRNFNVVGYVQAQQFCVWTLLIDRRFDSNDLSV